MDEEYPRDGYLKFVAELSARTRRKLEQTYDRREKKLRRRGRSRHRRRSPGGDGFSEAKDEPRTRRTERVRTGFFATPGGRRLASAR
jgi:hypothetical protein